MRNCFHLMMASGFGEPDTPRFDKYILDYSVYLYLFKIHELSQNDDLVAKIIVSDSIRLAGGRHLVEKDISPLAAFYLFPVSPSTLFLDGNGKLYVYHTDFYPIPTIWGMTEQLR